MNQIDVFASDLPPEALQAMESADQFPLPLGIAACLIFAALGLWFIRAPEIV